MSSMAGQSSYRPDKTATGLKGSNYNIGSYQKFSPEQMSLFQKMFGQVGPDSYLSKLAGGDQSQFEQLEAPALRQFGELQGNIASRFSGMGSTGARKSSGFQNAMNSASSNFAQDLQSQRMNIQRQALQDLMGISNSLLDKNPYETYFLEKEQKQPSWWERLLGGVGGAAAKVGTSKLTGGFF